MTVPQAERFEVPMQVVDAKSEYLGEFRDDVCIFLPPELINNLVIKGRFENIPRSENTYPAFSDGSGGREDSAALAIAHKHERKIILDYIKNFLGFEILYFNGVEIAVPDWFISILAVLLCGVPWYWRRFNFSLRNLLIATTLIALALGWIAHAARG